MSQLSNEEIISVIRNSIKWKRERQPQHVNIGNITKKEAIKDLYPSTVIQDWKKEYAWYIHKETRYRVKIHRFVNKRKQTQEYEVKIKIPVDKRRLREIINNDNN